MKAWFFLTFLFYFYFLRQNDSVFTSIHILLFSTANCESLSFTFLFQLWSIPCQVLSRMFGTFIMNKVQRRNNKRECETYALTWHLVDHLCLENLRYTFGRYFSTYKTWCIIFLPRWMRTVSLVLKRPSTRLTRMWHIHRIIIRVTIRLSFLFFQIYWVYSWVILGSPNSCFLHLFWRGRLTCSLL